MSKVTIFTPTTVRSQIPFDLQAQKFLSFYGFILKGRLKRNVGIYLYTEKEETHGSPDRKPASFFRYRVLKKKT